MNLSTEDQGAVSVEFFRVEYREDFDWYTWQDGLTEEEAQDLALTMAAHGEKVRVRSYVGSVSP